ncbi:Rid family hydrolase [Prauserella oleivorans]|uniref:Rid family hydrolase n=1 Tax=Prauserella oleivorans TaxID=1478153 RepID=A0ABW5WEL7_9PSEU
MKRTVSTRAKVAIAIAATAAVTVPATAVAGGLFPPRPTESVTVLPEGQDNPMIADGVAIGKNVAWYKSSGLGPADMNDDAPEGSEQRYIPTDLFPGADLPEGVTLTEAQALGALRRIGENLENAGLSFDDVVSMRVFLQNPDGEDRLDFAGFNRAYRQFFANTSVSTGEVIDVPLGSAAPAPPMVVNPARPSRFVVEVENLPVEGWLVEIEVDAVYPAT